MPNRVFCHFRISCQIGSYPQAYWPGGPFAFRSKGQCAYGRVPMQEARRENLTSKRAYITTVASSCHRSLCCYRASLARRAPVGQRRAWFARGGSRGVSPIFYIFLRIRLQTLVG